MSSQQLLLEITLALNSNKKKEKLNALEKLTSLLSQEAAVKVLHKNSKAEDSSLNWDVLFSRVHHGVVSLCDESSAKSRQMCDKHVQIAHDAVSQVIQKGCNKKCPCINTSLIGGSVLDVFETDTRARILGGLYLDLFHKYVLSERKNWFLLKKEHWVGIKNICKNHFNSQLQGIHSISFLQILVDIIRHSSKTCQITHNFLDLFPFLKDAYASSKKYGCDFEIALLHLTNTLCLQLAIEFRYKVCEFMEEVFGYVKNLQDNRYSDKSMLCYHFFLTSLNIHNPNGLWEEKIFYACDVKKWKSQIREIYFLCYAEIRAILKKPREREVGVDLFNLFVDVLQLIPKCSCEDSPDTGDSDVSFAKPGPSNKRKCLSETPNAQCSRAKQIKIDENSNNLLINLNTKDVWFWLEVLELVLLKYPFSLKEDYCQLVEFLYQLICDKKDCENTKVAIRCLISLLELENTLGNEPNGINVQWLDGMWNKISTELIRFLSTETYSEAHVLIRTLISHYKLRDIEPLIKLYCFGTLRPGLENFKTLCTVCQHCILPEIVVNEKDFTGKQENYGKVREELLNWLFQGKERFPCKDLAKVLVALILKKFEEDIVITPPKVDALIPYININDFCRFITDSYLTVSFKNVKFVEDSNPVEAPSEIRLESVVKEKLFSLLQTHHKTVIGDLSNETLCFAERLKALENCLWFVELICHLLSHFECGSDDCEDCSFLTSVLQSSLSSCSAKSLNLLNEKYFDLTPFCQLFSAGFHPSVEMKIRQPEFINLDFLQYLFELLEDCLVKDDVNVDPGVCDSLNSVSRFSQLTKNPTSILHFQSLNKREKLIVNIVETLCQYITVPCCSDCNRYQSILAVKIVKNLTCEESFSITPNFYLQLVLRVVCSFSKHDGITVATLNDCLDLMQTIFNSKVADFEIVLTALQVLKDLTALVRKSGDPDSHLKYKKIVEELKDAIAVRKNYGVRVACKFIELLTEICRLDLEGDWQPSDGSCGNILEEIINFLKHPYHEVRLTAARHAGLLFVRNKDSKDSTADWQKKALKSLFEALRTDSDRYLVKEKGCGVEYYQYVASSVSLIAWASVICHSGYWRKKALFCLLHLGFLKKFPNHDVEEIVKLISRELKIHDETKYISHNFSYLFYKWAKHGLQIQDFPFRLLGYKSVESFTQTQYPVFVNVYVQLGGEKDVASLSSKLNKPVIHLLKECHSQLLAFILPALSENVNSEVTRKVQKLKRFIDETVGSKTSMQWLTEFLDKVIFTMIRNMHDPPYLLSLCKYPGNLKDDKNPAGYSAARIVETLENLGTNEGRHLLGKVALEVPSMIEKVLRWLLEGVVTAIMYEEKVFAFYKYVFFVEATGKATRKGSEYLNVNFFIVRDVVYTVAGILRKAEDEFLTDMACECFRKLGDAYLEEFSPIVGEFLPAITTALTPAVKRGNKKALKVLNFFIYENFSKLGSYIALFDIFPPEDVFNDINKQIQRTQVYAKNLKNTIKRFISTGRSKNSGCRVESLKNLRKMLSDNKIELKEMYEELKLLKGFSEDCKNSQLHQLICMLVELTSDENTLVSIEAAKCLGELGPSDLTTLVLRPESNFIVSKSNVPAVCRLLRTAIGILSDFLVSDNYDVKKASSKALYAVLSTTQGREILQEMKETPVEGVECLTPFVSKCCQNLHVNVRKDVLLNKFGQRRLWRPDSHEKWIVGLVESLLLSLRDASGVVDAFVELIRVNWQFAESIFPICVDVVLSLREEKCNEMINKNISAFLEEHFDYKEKSSPSSVNKASVRCILNVVDYIRMQRNHEGCYQGFDLNVNFLHVAKAALYCSAYFTSIFYAELWFEEKKKTIDSYVDVNMICEVYPEEGFALAEILRKCHFEIGNLDGIHGCGYMHILNSTSEIQHYEHLKNWSLSMLHHDIQLSQRNVSSEMGLFHSLERFGMCYTLNQLIKTRPETPEMTAIQYRCAAKLHDWSQMDSTYKRKNNLTPDCFDKCYYFALKAYHDEDVATFQNESHRTRKVVLSELAHCSLESSKNLYLFITQLQCLKELEEFATVVLASNAHQLAELFQKWDRQDEIKCGEFKLVESILTNRTIMIRDAWEKEKNDEMKNCLETLLCRTYYKLTAAARKEKKYETAIRTLSYFNSVRNAGEDIAGKMKVEKARILWERGDREIGTFLLNHFLKKKEISGELRLKTLRIYGDWMATTKSENSREIIENYYLKSIAQSAGSPNRIHSFASLAKFAYSIYEQFNEYLSSPLFEIKQSLISTQQGLASELRQELGWNQNVEKRKAYQIAAKQSAIDENEIKNSKAERDSYLTLAIKYYLLSLKEGEKYDLVVFRIVSLWLSNSSNGDVVQQLQKYLQHIPSYKFLCLLPQLVPRMADVCLISDLVERILLDHPYHTLPLLFAISNSYEDLTYSGEKSTISSPRVLAANSMIKKFETNNKLQRLIAEMRRFSSALIELANYNPPDRGRPGMPVNFPEHLQIRRITNLTFVPVPSLHIPYSKNCTYNGIIGVREFELQYHLVGGINLPKRITCIGSDGVGRPLLVKGKDDLRQDAVMQQVFTIMNSLLYQNKETSKRKLLIRTYKVVPLSQRSGIIEWCENTQPLSLYLVGPDGKSGAHKKYFPDDASAFDCRCMIRSVFAQPHVTNEQKLKVFLDACKQLHPVFHNFFIEKFPAAGVWFERRLAYIHSVATSSMIGYILGLGDRHVHNILIDNATAEVIHIDLGIAFEQGKTLPTPETVPFRLTRDIVDGMGLSGVEGDFRISCIKAMEVLRENQDTILTLLQVLLYDPLYTWTITPEKAYSIQNQTETGSTTTEKSSPDLETNKMAERALIRLKQKLQGTEAGIGATTVEGQVRILINEARDPNNLCRLFHGWQAYL